MSAALIVIDVQNGFVTEGSRHVIEPITDLVRRAGDLNVPVSFTRFFNTPGGAFMRWVRWDRLTGPPETDLHPDIMPVARTIFDKTSYTGLTADVRSWLAGHDVTRIYCAGISTEGCVLKTAVDAFEAEIEPIVITDACASHAGPVFHDMGLKVISRFIGSAQMRSLEQALKDRLE